MDMVERTGLPSRIGAEEMLDLVEKVAFHPGMSENEVRMRLSSPNEFQSTRRACILLGLLQEKDQNGGLSPTELGRHLVYATTEERRGILLKEALLKYDLYEVPLGNILKEHTEPFDIQPADLHKYWMVHFKLDLSKDLLDRSATTLLKLLDYCGIGSYTIGRKGKPTRLEMPPEGYNRLVQAYGDLETARREAARTTISAPAANETSVPQGPQLTMLPSVPPNPREALNKLPVPVIQEPANQNYQMHKSKDGSVVLWIMPSGRSIEFLKRLLPVLELEASDLTKTTPTMAPPALEEASAEESPGDMRDKPSAPGF